MAKDLYNGLPTSAGAGKPPAITNSSKAQRYAPPKAAKGSSNGKRPGFSGNVSKLARPSMSQHGEKVMKYANKIGDKKLYNTGISESKK